MIDRHIHVFDNGVKVFDDHLNPPQRERYRLNNVHEVDEEPIFLEILGSLPDDGVFVGLGAAIGYYAILARRLRPTLAIHSFEPLRVHQQAMKENIGLNELELSSFPIHVEAVAEHDGHTWLMEESYSSALMKGVPFDTRLKDGVKKLMRVFGVRSYEPTHRVKVPTLSLDSIVERLGGRVDLLQMDVQGLELDALRGGGAL